MSSLFKLGSGGIALVALVGLSLAAPAPASAQTFGTDQGSCDRTAIQSMLSTSKGNIIGSLGGAALGGLVGNQFGGGSGKGIMTLMGVLGGAVAGGYVGRQVDPADSACTTRTLENTPTGQTVAWENPDGQKHWVTPTGNYQGNDGRPCRNFVSQAVIDGQTQQVQGTACRDPDGTWRTVKGGSAAGGSTDTVFKVQQRLHDLGFYVRDNIDGKWGPNTSAAVGNFQRSQGLPASGQLDQPTMAALQIAPDAQQPVAQQPVAQQPVAQGSSQPAAPAPAWQPPPPPPQSGTQSQ